MMQPKMRPHSTKDLIKKYWFDGPIDNMERELQGLRDLEVGLDGIQRYPKGCEGRRNVFEVNHEESSGK